MNLTEQQSSASAAPREVQSDRTSSPAGPLRRTIEYRAAHFTDSAEIARFLCMAGGGVFEFLFDDLVPLMSARELLTVGVAGDDQTISYRNCCVAFDPASGQVVGAANAFPADLLKEETYPLLPSDRQEHIRPIMQLQDWGSMFLNALAVDDAARNQGVGTRLLDWARGRARELALDRLSLHVWADNTVARRLYKAQGFAELGTVQIPPHPRLAHRASVLMSLALPPRRSAA